MMTTTHPGRRKPDIDHERSLIERMKKGDAAAARDLVMGHQALAAGYARRYKRRFSAVQFEDLLHEGMIGLLEAARRFDPGRGVHFSTYARWWVRHCVHSFVQRNARAVAAPNTRAMRRYGPRYGVLEHDAEQRLGRRATLGELAAHAGVAREDLEQVAAYRMTNDCSYDALVTDLPSVAADAEQQYELAQRREALGRAVRICIDEMGERASRILDGRHLGQESRTLRELGEELGVSRERVRQLERQCLDRIWQVVRERPVARAAEG